MPDKLQTDSISGEKPTLRPPNRVESQPVLSIKFIINLAQKINSQFLPITQIYVNM